jgi:hypothetical protein
VTVRAVGVSSAVRGVVRQVDSDPSDGTFTLTLSAGTWRLAVIVDSALGFQADVVGAGTPTRTPVVVVAGSAVSNIELTLQGITRQISG